MKKIIALTLVIFTLASLLASCTDPSIDPNDTNPGTNADGTPIEGYTAVNEVVYVIANGGLNVRSTPDVPEDGSDNKLGSLSRGQAVTRTGINEITGWSRIMYNNEVAFVKSEYLSTEEPEEDNDSGNNGGGSSNGTAVSDDKFTACNDETEIYVTDSSNNDAHVVDGDATVYKTANRSDVAGSLKDGTKVTRVAVYYENENDHEIGWSKIQVSVDGETETYFIRNSQLKIEMVKADA